MKNHFNKIQFLPIVLAPILFLATSSIQLHAQQAKKMNVLFIASNDLNVFDTPLIKHCTWIAC